MEVGMGRIFSRMIRHRLAAIIAFAVQGSALPAMDHLTTWTYTYCENEWLNLVTWPTRRLQQLPLVLP